jgi:hypothetical protein
MKAETGCEIIYVQDQALQTKYHSTKYYNLKERLVAELHCNIYKEIGGKFKQLKPLKLCSEINRNIS